MNEQDEVGRLVTCKIPDFNTPFQPPSSLLASFAAAREPLKGHHVIIAHDAALLKKKKG